MKKTHASVKRILGIVMTVAMLIGMLPLYAVATDYPTITADQGTTVTLDGTYVTESIFKFIPEEDGVYIFWSYNNSHDTYGYILDSGMQELQHNDDDGEYNNFRVQYELVAGETYYLKSRFFTMDNAGSFQVTVKKAVPATSIIFTSDEAYEVNAGYYFEFKYELSPENYIAENVEFTSSNPEVVRIEDDNGYALKAGTSTITATSENGLTNSVVLTVLDTPTVEAGTEIVFTCDGYNTDYYRFVPTEDGMYGIYSYNNTYETDLMLSAFADDTFWVYGEETPNGSERIQHEMTAGAEYLLRIRSYDPQTFNVKIEKLVAATDVSINEESCTGPFGTIAAPIVSFTPANAIREDYTLSVKDTDIASVNEDGTVSLHKIGTTEITVTTENGLSDTVTLTVEDYEDVLLEKNYYFTPTSNNNTIYYRFIPEEDGVYSFAGSGGFDTYGCLYNSNDEILVENNDFTNYNFWFSCHLTGGETYILFVEAYNVHSPNENAVGIQVNMLDENGSVIHDIEEYTYTEDEHYGYCNRCNTDVTASHSYGEDNFCICGFKHEHQFSYTYNENSHDSYCESCGSSFNGEHSFTDGVCACGYPEHEHLFKWHDPSFSNEDRHDSYCAICLLSVENEHNFGEDGVCSDCGYEIHEHVWSSDGYVYETYHDGYCEVCNNYIYGEHQYNDDGKCICGLTLHEHTGEFTYVYEDRHVVFCDVCGFSFSQDHVLDSEGRCNCGYVNHTHDFTEYFYDNSSHMFRCSSCTVLEDIPYAHHDAGNGKCECGYEFLSGVLIGDKSLTDGQYIDTDGKVSDTEPEEWSAHYTDGVLTLKDLTLNATEEEQYAIMGYNNLEIVVEGTVVLSTVDNDVIHLEEGDLIITGDGTMHVTAYGNYDGIDAAHNGDVTIDGPTIYIKSVDHGIEAEEKFTMESGIVIIDAGDDGVDSEDNVINGGIMIIHAEDIGIDADDNTTVNGGYLNITTNDEDGFEAGGYIRVNDGHIVINADECGFNSHDDCVEINGGDIYVESDKGAISAYESIYVAEDMGKFESAYDGVYDLYFLAKDGEILKSVHLTADNSDTAINGNRITLSADSAEYTGEDLLPTVTVTDNDGNALTENTDYTVTWSAKEAVNEGVYFAVIEGIGDYSGTHYVLFTVTYTFVYVGGVKVQNGEYLANGETETTKEKPDGGFAYLEGGVLTLNNFEYEGEGYRYEEKYTAAIFSDGDLVIDVVGINEITNPLENCDGIVINDSVTLIGNGTLTVNSDYGIYCGSGNVNLNECTLILNSTYTGIYSGYDITINSGSIQINAEDGMYCYGDVTINGGITVIDVAKHGIEAEAAINVNGGYTDVTSGRIALQTYEYKFADGVAMILPENGEIRYVNGYRYVYADGEVAGSVVFADTNYGDANTDGKINLSDVSVILQFIASWDVLINEFAADANADGKINLSDVSLLLQYIAGWDVTLG